MIAFAMGPVVLQASTQSEEDRMVINTLNATDFEVVQGTNYGPAEYWCGAATYIERRAGLSETTPVYVKHPQSASLTVPGRKSVVFTTSNAGLLTPSSQVSLTVDQPGAALKSAQARRFCRDAFTRSTK